MSRLAMVRWVLITSWLLGVAGLGLAQSASSRVGAKADLQALQAAFADLAETMRPSVVAIRAERRVRTAPEGGRTPATGPAAGRLLPSIGSGVIIREDGMILTNEHVVAGAEKILVVLYDGSSHEVTAVHADSRSDLAVVEIDVEGLRPATLGDLSQVKQGHWAFAMGNPLGLAADGGMVMSHGIVSAIGRKLQIDPSDSRYYGNLIQTSAAINPGNSGGPLVNIDGDVIGITTAISTRTGANEGIGFAVPIEGRTKAIIAKLLAGEAVEYGYIGVTVRTPSQVASRTVSGSPLYGAMIEKVEPASPAEKAALAEGDVIVEFDGAAVEDADHLVRLVGAAPVGKAVSVVYRRQGRRTQTSVSLVSRKFPHGAKTDELTWRGMTLSELTLAIRERFSLSGQTGGLVVTSVEPKSVADRAGFKAGQRIVRVDAVSVNTIDRLGEMIPALRKVVTLTLADRTTIDLPPR